MSEDMLRMMDENEEVKANEAKAVEDGAHGEGDEGVHSDADSDGAALDNLDDGYEDDEERGPIWDAMVQTTKLQLRLNEDIAGATKVKLVTFNGIVPNKTDDELNLLSDKLASLFAYPSVGFVRIDTKTYKPGNPLL